MGNEYVKCTFCGDINIIEEAIENDWVLYFYGYNDKEFGSVCRKCADHFLIMGGDGEYEIKKKGEKQYE